MNSGRIPDQESLPARMPLTQAALSRTIMSLSPSSQDTAAELCIRWGLSGVGAVLKETGDDLLSVFPSHSPR